MARRLLRRSGVKLARKREQVPRPPVWFETLEPRVFLSVDVLSYHNSFTTPGVNAAEVQLTPTNVNTTTFGKAFTVPVDGQVYAQPLIDTGVTITGGINTSPDTAGVHDVVFVATEFDSLYAVDANGGSVLWKRSFLNTTNAGGNVNNTLGATSITPVSHNDTGGDDIIPYIGITGTPVIDPSTDTLFVVAKTRETVAGVVHYVQRLHAINTGDGTDRVTPYLIGDTSGSNTNNTQIYVYGTGDGHVTDPYNGTGRQVTQFHALREHQRPALSLVDGKVYVSWASHSDNGPYHGLVASWDVSNLLVDGMVLSGVLSTSPNNGLAGIWMAGGQLAFEADGSAFYFETGNGSGGAPTLTNGFPSTANYNEALTKVVMDPASSPTNQNPNGWGIKVVDYFIPYNVVALDGADSDFGSGAPLILPDSAGIPGHPRLMIAGGKEGKLYLVDRDNLGHFNASNDNVINSVPNGGGHLTPPNVISGLLSTPVWYNGKLYVTSGYSGPAKSFTISPGGSLTASSQTSVGNFGYLPGSPTISSNGSTNGIVWIMDRVQNQIRAYDANTFSTELWNSNQKPGGADHPGAVVKFAVPTVANGKVFVGTTNSLVVYGLSQAANDEPLAPALAATTLSGSSINLTWTDSTQAPNSATGYSVEISTDNNPFQPVTTSPAGSTSIAIGGLTKLTAYSFRIRGFNAFGNSVYSNVAVATTTNDSATIDYSAGFAGSGSALTLNGAAAHSGAKLRLTGGGTNQAASAFVATAVDITAFSSDFTFQTTGTNTGEGLTFTLQKNAPTALGMSGAGLGYGGITNSAAIKFDLVSNQGEGGNSTGLYTGGVSPAGAGSIDLTPAGLDLHSGHVFHVSLAYDGATLTSVIRDTQTGVSTTKSYSVNLPAILGAGTAYAGFTASTGTLSATQDILTWTLSPGAVVSPNAPSGLGAVAATADSISLHWTSNATNQTGYHLDRAIDPDFTQSFITINLPAGPASYIDTTTGLAPGGTYYYRLRAYNSVGDSGNSNVADVSIPLAPPKPTDQELGAVTATSIDMSWQDNAGHQADGYKVLRAANHGPFIVAAILPPTSRAVPSIYEWTDIDLTPGTLYEYHIISYNSSGNNDFAGLNATTLTSPPLGLAASGGNSLVTLTWAAPAGAASFNIYRGTTAGDEDPTPIATGVVTSNYLDSTAVNGVTYFYKVTAVNSNAAFDPPVPSEGAASNEAQATPSSIANPGFELPSLGAGQWVFRPNGTGWTFTGNAGIENNGSAWGAANAPAGIQAAMLQGNGNAGALTQSITLATGSYQLSFQAARRNGQVQPLRVSVDGVQIGGLITPAGNGFSLFTTPTFTLTTGTHSIKIEATDNAGDRTSFIDSVSLANAGPPPVLIPPTVANPAAASSNPVTGTSVNLSVLGADDGGEASLTYTWVTTGSPPAPVAFSVNGNNAAKNAAATFTKAGVYNFQATIADAGGQSVTSSVSVTVNQTLTSITVGPTSANVPPSGTQPFTATASDQFGNALSTQPALTWSVNPGGAGGTVNSAGLYTAPASAGNGDTIKAAGGVIFGTASVSVGAVNLLANAGFESPSLGAGQWVFRPTGAGWSFTGNAGIESNGSAWGAANAPAGTQAAMLQDNGNVGSLTQSLTLAAGSYQIGFQAARRNGQVQPLRVSVDGIQIGGLITPAGNGFSLFTTPTFTLTAGTHSIKIEGTENGGDISSFIDSASLVAVGTPATQPQISIGDVTQTEGDGGFVDVVFTATLNTADSQTVTVNYATADGTAKGLRTLRVASGLGNPLFAAAPPGDNTRLFIVEQGVSGTARVKILNRQTGVVGAVPFLTLGGIGTGGERGLLGLAFHPDYASNGFVFVNFTNADGDTVVRRYTVSGNPDLADTATAMNVLTFAHPMENHYGGWMGFGPDGYLYVATGDGGGAGDPQNSGQRLDTLQGKMLRINIDGDDFTADAERNYAIPADNPFANDGNADTLAEVWAYGLRNPWRNSFDAETGDLYIADVGQAAWEEINVQPVGAAGGTNYGWKLREGTTGTKPPGAIDPAYQYSHGPGASQGHSVTGGYVYRGPLAELRGMYFFGDFVDGRVWSLRFDGDAPPGHDGTNFTDFIDWTPLLSPGAGAINNIASFAQTPDGNLFLLDYDGDIFQLANGADYAPASGTLTFDPGQTSKTITVRVLRDQWTEASEQFVVNLTNAVNATISDGQGWATIADDDAVPPSAPPTVATPAAANPVAGTAVNLSVLGADDGGEASLIYTWAATGSPPAPVAFGANASHAARNTAATFAAAGVYTLQATITDASGQSVTSSVSVTVHQTLTSITVAAPPSAIASGGTHAFTATALDQFGNAMSEQPSFTWSINPGGAGGTINASGLYSAPPSGGGTDTVKAAVGGINGTASVTVLSATNLLTNGGFETPALGGGMWQFSPGGGGWIFAGNAGIQSNGSAWGATNAPGGTQAAMLQGNHRAGAMSQTVSLPAGDYQLSFAAARRNGQSQPLRVTVDGVQVGGLVTPVSNTYAPFTLTFGVAAGSHTIKFEATEESSDVTTFVDLVELGRLS